MLYKSLIRSHLDYGSPVYGSASEATLRAQVAKSEGHRGIQAEAVLTVARGLTSLDELKRVFSKK